MQHPNSYPKSHRLHHSDDINRVYRQGRRFVLPPFRVHFIPNELGYPRIAIAISGKCGGSIVRNRVKRKIREFFRMHRDLFGAKDYCFFATQNLAKLSKERLSEFFRNLPLQLAKTSSFVKTPPRE